MMSYYNERIYDSDEEDFYTTCEDCMPDVKCSWCQDRLEKDKAIEAERVRKQTERYNTWHKEYIRDKVFYEMSNLRITRLNLINAGLNADVILLRELLAKQAAAKNVEESIDHLRILFGYLLTVPDFLDQNPKVSAALRDRLVALKEDPRAAILSPLMDALTTVLG
jgi:hypothetical protein